MTRLNIFEQSPGTEQEGIWVEKQSPVKMEFISIEEYNDRMNAPKKVVGQRERGRWVKPLRANKPWFVPTEQIERIGSDRYDPDRLKPSRAPYSTIMISGEDVDASDELAKAKAEISSLKEELASVKAHLQSIL